MAETEPAASEAVELEDPMTVITTVIGTVAGLAALLVVVAVRMHLTRERQKKKAERSAPPGAVQQADVDRLKRWLQEKEADDEEGHLLRGLAGAKVLSQVASGAGERARSRRTASLHKALQRAGCALSLRGEPDDDALVLLCAHLYRERLPRQLDAETEEAVEAAAEVAVRLLARLSNEYVKGGSRLAASAIAKLQACCSLGLWSWEEARCKELMAARLAEQGCALPEPRLAFSVKSWMGSDLIAPGSTIEATIEFERLHAGKGSGEPYQRTLRMRGQQSVTVFESYTCLLSRQAAGSGGGAGSVLDTLVIDVEDFEQQVVTTRLKFCAPLEPGDYYLSAQLLLPAVLGVEANASCGFTVSRIDDERFATDDEDDDYD